MVKLKIRLKGFETHTRQRKMSTASNTGRDIFAAVWKLYRTSRFIGQPVRLIGVGISEWSDGEQMEDLFDEPEQRERKERLYAALDEVAEKFGRGKLSLGLEK